VDAIDLLNSPRLTTRRRTILFSLYYFLRKQFGVPMAPSLHEWRSSVCEFFFCSSFLPSCYLSSLHTNNCAYEWTHMAFTCSLCTTDRNARFKLISRKRGYHLDVYGRWMEVEGDADFDPAQI
jgi:hypothetical protein